MGLVKASIWDEMILSLEVLSFFSYVMALFKNKLNVTHCF
jgi:hypothetical protein